MSSRRHRAPRGATRRLIAPAAAFLALAAPVAGSPLPAQDAPPQLTEADYSRAESRLARTAMRLVHGTAEQASWLDDRYLTYRATRAGEASRWRLVDARRGRVADAFDHARLAAALTAALGRDVDPERLPLRALAMAPDRASLTAAVGRSRVRCDLRAYACDTAPAGRPAPPASIVSPDGRKAAYIREYDLWVRDLETGDDTRLTVDGTEEYGYATNNAGWTHGPDPVLTWSPDSRRIATFRHDGRGVRDMYLVSTNVGSPDLKAWKYPLPGDSVVFRIERVVIDVEAPVGQRVVRLDLPPDAHRSTVSDHVRCSGGTVCDLRWFPDGERLAFVSSSRDHKRAWFRVADARTGAVRTLFEETSETQIGDASLDDGLWQLLPETDELLWWSQRDDWVHLYLYDLGTGTLKNRVTTGDGNVTSIVRLDPEARQVFFTAVGRENDRDPYFPHLYSASLDGGPARLLTPEPAHHDVVLSPDGRYFVDTYSTPTEPPVTVLRRARDGRAIRELERADISALVASGWRAPVPVTVKGRDGTTDVYGLMYLPPDVDSAKRYPIIDYIYPGPQSGSVGPRRFSPGRRDHEALTELGFVVVAIDGMGTPDRSKTFHDTYYGRMGDNTIPDQVAAIRQLAERYPFIDLERTGIWGHSGGGFATAAAMFRADGFFKVGIAESGNHDNRNYEDDWGERYQGLLVREGDTDNYAAEANQTHAAKLQGKLFLIHGMMDDNVPPYNTLLVADALMKANKDFDLLMLPQARHGFGADSDYIMRRRWDYFVQHLLGAEPPKEYEMGRDRRVP